MKEQLHYRQAQNQETDMNAVAVAESDLMDKVRTISGSFCSTLREISIEYLLHILHYTLWLKTESLVKM